MSSSCFRTNLPPGVYCDCEYDRESNTYDPGDEVTGRIHFKTLDRGPIQCLKARLIGCEGVNFGSDFRASSRAFLVMECYAQLTVDQGDLEDYMYPFAFHLPSNALPTFHGQYGSIRYYVEAVVSGRRVVVGQTLDEVDLFMGEEYGRWFVVTPKLDLNSLPELQGPLFLVKDNSGGLRSLFTRNKNPIRCTLSLHKKGYIPSEYIHFAVDINNGSSKPITATTIKLVQDTKFHLSSMKRVLSETVKKIVGGSIQPKTTICWEDVLQVPEDIPITILGHSICITYRLKVTLVTSGFSENVKGDLGITIGTIGIDDFAFLQQNGTQVRSNSFTSSRDTLSPRIRQRPITHHHAPFRNTHLNYRRSISSLPSYMSVEREDAEETPPPTYIEAMQKQSE